MLIGLTGGLGAGKSLVANCWREVGARVIDADALAREAVAPGQPAYCEIVSAFGNGVVREDGSLDRPRLARVVFGDAEARERLHAIVHPRVREREWALTREYEQEGADLIVWEVPLLFENGLDAEMDATVLVWTEDEIRRRRLRQDRGMTDEEIDRRLAAQMPEAEKRSRADHVIDNSGSREATREAARNLAARFRRENPRGR